MGTTCVCCIEPFKFRLTITIISLKRTINLLIIIKKSTKLYGPGPTLGTGRR